MKVNRCPFCNSKSHIYPFIAKYETIYEPKHLFKQYYFLKAHTKEIPIYWTVECSNYCDEWIEQYNKKDSIIAKETKEDAIKEWNNWVEALKKI